MTMSVAPSVRSSWAMAMIRSGGTEPEKGQVNEVAMQSSICPPTDLAMSVASGIAASEASVERPMLASLWASEAEKQY